MALDQLDDFLVSDLSLRIAVEGAGLSRGARIEEHLADVITDEPVLELESQDA
jgi:hypothetical protein